jgi:hypothetical protein
MFLNTMEKYCYILQGYIGDVIVTNVFGVGFIEDK